MEMSCLWASLFTCLNSHVFLVLGDPYTSYLAGGEGVVYGVGSRGLSPREPQSTPSPLQGSPASLTQALFLSVCLHPIQISLFYLLGLQGFLLICCCCLAELRLTPWTAARQAPLSSTVSRSLLQFMSTESMMSLTHLSSPVVPLLSSSQSFPASGSFPSQLFPSGGQSVGASLSVLPMNIQG